MIDIGSHTTFLSVSWKQIFMRDFSKHNLTTTPSVLRDIKFIIFCRRIPSIFSAHLGTAVLSKKGIMISRLDLFNSFVLKDSYQFRNYCSVFFLSTIGTYKTILIVFFVTKKMSANNLQTKQKLNTASQRQTKPTNYSSSSS